MSKHALPILFALALTPALLAQDPPKTSKLPDLLPRVSLGVAVEEMPDQGPHGGLVIRDLAPEGPAAKAGLKKGDVIVRVSNREVDDFDELIGTLAGHRPGDQLTFTVLRDRRPQDVKVTLGEPGKETEKSAWNPEGTRACAFLGVITVPVDALSIDTRDRLGIEDPSGVMVLDVVPGSAAAEKGLRHGDVIVTVNGEDVENPNDLRLKVRRTGEKEMTLKMRRGEQTREVKVTPGKGPCDVLLTGIERQDGGNDDAARKIERLEQRIDRLERQLQELERKRGTETPRRP